METETREVKNGRQGERKKGDRGTEGQAGRQGDGRKGERDTGRQTGRRDSDRDTRTETERQAGRRETGRETDREARDRKTGRETGDRQVDGRQAGRQDNFALLYPTTSHFKKIPDIASPSLKRIVMWVPSSDKWYRYS